MEENNIDYIGAKELVFNALNSTPLKQVCKILRIKRILNVDLLY